MAVLEENSQRPRRQTTDKFLSEKFLYLKEKIKKRTHKIIHIKVRIKRIHLKNGKTTVTERDGEITLFVEYLL